MRLKKINPFIDSDGNDITFDQSISDLMSALLLIFILLLMALLIKMSHTVEVRSSSVKRYNKVKTELYQELFDEFEMDLSEWGAEIDKENLVIRFNEPDVLFLPNEATLRTEFKRILSDFFPRYLNIIYSSYQDSIEEIRIEGHTANPEEKFSFMSGMLLSQERTNSVLRYILYSDLISDAKIKNWTLQFLTSNGMSHSRPILNENDIPDWTKSRRVEFRIKTNAEKVISEYFDSVTVNK